MQSVRHKVSADPRRYRATEVMRRPHLKDFPSRWKIDVELLNSAGLLVVAAPDLASDVAKKTLVVPHKVVAAQLDGAVEKAVVGLIGTWWTVIEPWHHGFLRCDITRPQRRREASGGSQSRHSHAQS